MHFSAHIFGGILAQRAHGHAQLLGGDGAVAVLVEHHERLAKLVDLLGRQVLDHLVRVVRRHYAYKTL